MSSEDTSTVEATINQGEFSSKKSGYEPDTSGHQPGKLISEADKAPEFHAETLPAGTAPPESTFQPNPSSDIPVTTAETQQAEKGTGTKASETLTGTDSGSVHQSVSGEK